MDPEILGVEEFFRSLDQLGEAQVQRLLDTGEYPAQQQPFVREWLLRRAEDRARRQSETERG